MVKDVFFLSSSATSSLNEANESSEDNNLTAPPLINNYADARTYQNALRYNVITKFSLLKNK
jgi:hypothetical protein